jgi:hypothetical protein
MAVLEQTSREGRAVIGVTQTWAGPEATHVDEAMREACPWNGDGRQKGFVDRVGIGVDRTMLLQAFAVVKVLGRERLEGDDIWDPLLRSWLWTGPSWHVGSPSNVSKIFYDSLRNVRSFAGHKGVIKSCMGVVYGNDRIRRLTNRARAGQLDIYSLIAELEVCFLARFILDSSVAGASIDKHEWCDSFRQTVGSASPTSCGVTIADYALDSDESVRSQEELLDANVPWELMGA